MSAIDELSRDEELSKAEIIAGLRRFYAALGWSLRRVPGTTRTGLACDLFYASTAHGRFTNGQGETIWTDSPLATLQAVLAHPSTRKALAG